MKTLWMIPLFAAMALLFATCKNDPASTEPAPTEGKIAGIITDAAIGGPVAGVTITGTVAGDSKEAQSDAEGKFYLTVSLQDSVGSIVLSMHRAGYRDTTMFVTLIAGKTTNQVFSLMPNRVVGPAGIGGTIFDGGSNAPLAGVKVRMQVMSPTRLPADSMSTNLLGEFAFKTTVDTTSVVTLFLTSTGFRDTTVLAKVSPGQTTNLTIALGRGVAGSGTGGTGTAQTIAFLSVDNPQISVYGVGGKETALLDWEVRDSLGQPIDVAHAVQLTFSMAGGPNGGEYLSPRTVTTTAGGRATVTFNAGTRSGAVQIMASTTVNGRTIISAPVRVVIVGGYPDQAHFTIATPTFNFPALDVANMRHQISVLVGDKYSNPAALSTVYFRSSAGVVQGTFGNSVTTADGQGAVDLISGNPRPIGTYAAPAYGDGYHYVVATTVGEGGATVHDSLLLLWSGAAQIANITPATFDIPDSGSQTFTFNVMDELGHPLAMGTTIGVSATIPPPPADGIQQNQVSIGFGNQGTLTLPDMIFPGPGRTQFTMTLRDGSWNIHEATPVTLTITVTGPNTNGIPLTATISGLVH